MRFSQSFIEQVQLASDIVPLIMEDTVLKGKGNRLMGLCPFPDHLEKTPSFSVSQDRQVYYCFGCMKSGNIFTYLKEQRGLGFVEAVERLARQAGLSLPVSETKRFKPVRNSEELLKLNEKACEFYRHHLDRSSSNHEVRACLRKRAYTKDTIQNFKLGYAPKGNVLLRHLKGEEQKKAFHLGLLNKNERGEMYDTYRNRLMFPILSSRHQVIGFGARALDDSLPKYINSKESDVFHKGRSLYGLYESLRFLRQEGFALVVEGYTDFLSLWQGGIKNLAATLGTALTDYQARVLKRYVDSVTLIFDGDSAGTKAGEKSLPLLLSAGLEVKSVTLPEGQDPDHFVKTQGVEPLKILIQNSEDLFFQILRKKLKEMKDQRGSFLSFINEMAPFLESVKNKALRSVYKQRVLDIFGSDARSLSKELERVCQNIRKNQRKYSATSSYVDRSVRQKGENSSNTDRKNQEKEKKPSLASALPAEQFLLVLCLDSEGFLKKFISLNGIQFIKTSFMSDIFENIKKKYGQTPKKFDTLLSSMMNQVSDGRLLLREAHIALKGNREVPEEVFNDCLSFLRKSQNFSEANDLVAEIKMTGKEDMKDLEQVFHLTKKRLSRQDVPVK